MLKSVKTLVVAPLAIMATATFLLVAGTSDASAARPCKSQAADMSTAEGFCEEQLKCSKKTPPQEIKCTGRTNRWMCKCVKPKGPSGGSTDAFFWMIPETTARLISLPTDG